MTEMKTRIFVITPVAITARDCMACSRIMLTILYTSHLKSRSVSIAAGLRDYLTQIQKVHIPNEYHQHAATPKLLLALRVLEPTNRCIISSHSAIERW